MCQQVPDNRAGRIFPVSEMRSKQNFVFIETNYDKNGMWKREIIQCSKYLPNKVEHPTVVAVH